MTEQKKKIIILTADAGFGHRSAANAIAEALEFSYGKTCQVKIINPMEDKRTPFFLRDSQSDYDKIVKEMPELYRLGYDASDGLIPTKIFESALIVLLYEVFKDLITEHQPDAIITTYPMYQAPLLAYFTISRKHIPFLNAVTDLVSVHRIWFHPRIDTCIVPTETVKKLARESEIPEEKIKISGIPVHPAITLEKRSKNELRSSLGWKPDLTTVLAVGSRRVEHLVSSMDIINHSGFPVQLAIVAGKDEDLFKELNNIEWHIPVKIYDYVENMPQMMLAADMLIAKAGGLIVTEALACKLPLLLIDALPGQEIGNMEYVIKNGAGEFANNPVKVLKTLSHWLMNDHYLLHERSQNAGQIGRPHAAFEAAEMVWQAAQQGPSNLTKWKLGDRTLLEKLLTDNKVSWLE